MASSPPTPDRPKILRHRPADQEGYIEDYAGGAGKILWEWNALHSSLFLIFWFLLSDASPDKIPDNLSRRRALSLWHTIQSDDLQRKMLISVATTTAQIKKPLLTRLMWVMKSADAIAPYRNVIAHVPMEFELVDESKSDDNFVAMPNTLTARPTSEWRFIYSPPEFWDDLGDDLFALGQYADLVRRAVWSPDEPFRWPHKPPLRCLPNIQEVNRQIGDRGARKAPRRRRGASSR
jgi:hypothetical protein